MRSIARARAGPVVGTRPHKSKGWGGGGALRPIAPHPNAPMEQCSPHGPEERQPHGTAPSHGTEERHPHRTAPPPWNRRAPHPWNSATPHPPLHRHNIASQFDRSFDRPAPPPTVPPAPGPPPAARGALDKRRRINGREGGWVGGRHKRVEIETRQGGQQATHDRWVQTRQGGNVMHNRVGRPRTTGWLQVRQGGQQATDNRVGRPRAERGRVWARVHDRRIERAGLGPGPRSPHQTRTQNPEP